MQISPKTLTVLGLALLALAGIVLGLLAGEGDRMVPIVMIIVGALGAGLASAFWRVDPETEMTDDRAESSNIRDVSDARQRELIRGTSKYLREMNYRYSIRLNAGAPGKRQSFTAEVNTVKLGFLPAVITDNTNDRQGYGYVAFVHDGTRWRGPGLPCPGEQVEAVHHATRCVSPLATEDETRFEEVR